MSKVLDKKLEKMDPKERELWALRHTAEHVLHTALQNLYPNLKKAMGPATPDGFYNDFDLNEKITEADFPKIEKEMQRLIDADFPMVQEYITPEKARSIFKNNRYKMEWVEDIKKRGEKISVYKMGEEEIDLCSGPHVTSTGKKNGGMFVLGRLILQNTPYMKSQDIYLTIKTTCIRQWISTAKNITLKA